MTLKVEDILGMNARNHEYLQVYNRLGAKRIANSKLLTKSTLRKAKLPTPRLFRVFRNDKDLESFDLAKLPESFVIKPNKGLGGEGIVVIEKGGKFAGEWISSTGEKMSVRDLQLHIGDIMEGSFSIDDAPDIAFVEERVRIHPVFKRYAYHGTPDVRVIVFNRVPVMAMLRIPTPDSGGRANLFQGAVGAGIDLASGITTYAIQYGKEIVFMPGSKRKVRGIQIPDWEEILILALKCQVVTGLGYLGADIVLQPSIKTPGKTLPKVLELNAQPGMKIQLCNKAGLRRRLQRVEGLEVETDEQGIGIARELFGDRNLARLGKKIKTIGVFEEVEVLDQLNERVPVIVKVDTGAFRSSIDESLAKKLGLLRQDNILMRKKYGSALGNHEREVIGLTFYLKGKKIETSASVADRSGLKRPMIIGRRDLKGFMVTF